MMCVTVANVYARTFGQICTHHAVDRMGLSGPTEQSLQMIMCLL